MALAQFRDEVQSEPRGHEAADDEAGDLDDVRVADDLHAAQRDDRGEDGEEQHAGQHADAGDAADRERAQVQDRGQVDDDVQAEPEQRHRRRDGLAVALFEELGHRVDVVLQIDRHEEHGDDDEGGGGHQFVHGDGHADAEARAAHADELLGGDVRSDQRRADGPPGERAFGQEVVVRGGRVRALLAAVDPQAVAGDDDEVDEEDNGVQAGNQIHKYVSVEISACFSAPGKRP